MRLLFTLMVTGILLMSQSAATAAVVTKRIEYRDGDTLLEGILTYDDSVPETEKRPGVLVCHSYWGVGTFTEARAQQLAQLGYVAFVLDVFGKGTETNDPKFAGERMAATVADLPALRKRAALGLKVLAEQPRVDPKRLAVIGYCFGGTVALELARSGLPHTENLQAVVAFHAARLAATGSDEEVAKLGGNVKGSVLVCHGAVDPLVKPGEVERCQKQFEDAKVDYVVISYAGAVHAFTDKGSDARKSPAAKYNANADRRSWLHMKDFFEEKMPLRPVAALPGKGGDRK
ncbi:MAG: dienelactone hydrolase family protein [Gemmataceae bacterium]|nr:dienelactone hydrolase family protein [Gemmataceae bacterium]